MIDYQKAGRCWDLIGDLIALKGEHRWIENYHEVCTGMAFIASTASGENVGEPGGGLIFFIDTVDWSEVGE